MKTKIKNFIQFIKRLFINKKINNTDDYIEFTQKNLDNMRMWFLHGNNLKK